MPKRIHRRALTSAICLAGTLLVACGGSDPATPPPPGIQPEIINAVDNFQFQVTAVDNHTGQLAYTWSNTGTEVDINQSCAVSAGVVTLAVFDNAWQQVYAGDLSQGGTYASTVGTTGTWHIRIDMSHASGDLNFRIDKRTP